MFCTASNKHTDTKITRLKQKYSNDNQKARRKIIELQPQIFIYSFQVKLNKTTYLSFKHIICRFMTESDNVTDNLVFAVNSLITLYQIRHFYLLAIAFLYLLELVYWRSISMLIQGFLMSIWTTDINAVYV